MTAARIGARAALASWKADAYLPIKEGDWDSYAYRMQRYDDALKYYSNTIYTSVNRNAEALRQAGKLYKHIRGIYNPVERLIEGIEASVYGGSIDMRELRTGAIPVDTDDDRLREAIIQIYRESKIRAVLSEYGRFTPLLGDGFLKVVDDTRRGHVRIEPLDARKVLTVDVDELGNVKSITIQYDRTQDNQTHVYTEIITKESFSTYRDGNPYAYVEDGQGNGISEWANPYGFVPVVHVPYKRIGYTFGAHAFNGQIIKIDNINDAASLLNDNLRNAVQVMYHAEGGRKGRITDNSDEPNRDDVRILYTDAGVTMTPLTSSANIQIATDHIESMLADMERDLPILALANIRRSGNLTQPGVRAASADLVKQIQEVQGNLDDGLIRATQMALSIAGYRGYAPFTLDSYDRGDLDFHIQQRDLFGDGLTKDQKVQYLLSLTTENPLLGLILEEMGYDIDAVEKAERRQRQAQQDALAREMASRANGNASALASAGRQARGAAEVNQNE